MRALPSDYENYQAATVAGTAFVFGAASLLLGFKKEPEPCPAGSGVGDGFKEGTGI